MIPYNTFIPTFFGYRKLNDPIVTGASIYDTAKYLKHHPDRIHVYFGSIDPKFSIDVCVEVFTNKVLFVLAKPEVGAPSWFRVRSLLRANNYSETFDAPRVADILDTGIENESLTIDFLARALKIKEPALNGFFTVSNIGLNLVFEQGLLVSYFPSDGLNTWGKFLQQLNPSLISDYEKQARSFWGKDSSKITNEVNAQAEAYADTPSGFSNKFIELHRTEYGLIDFCMLLACHYNAPMTIDEFKQLNHGRYEVINEASGVYKVRDFQYTFSPDGKLIDSTFAD